MCLGIPGQVVEITDAASMMGMVDVSGVRRAVNLACVAGDGPLEEVIGHWVLVHVGFAMSRIDPEEAAATLKALEDLGEAMAEIEAIRGADRMMEGETP
ncbi:MAG: HypC/HybG/HupF family hydrogenase formation chaperone [Rhodospirillum sp.]|nr:HypC/HybG/HupF family hydrogenase formation chaperone [Rhodospirillum sp.]MCF8491001.1 HypC/HybG/HupF family hydrogenase formation chaperone [Rhodospirillum sp.]MCF8499480.1 HypC/HybG/HupF family hydrogenase formation chaperone [Rhodospirillum sp.]